AVLSDLEITAIHQDRSGRLWLGTRKGLVRWDEPDRKVFTTHDGLSSDEVRAIADDLEGNLWIGTVGGGLNRLRLRDSQFTSFGEPGGLPSKDISSLYVDGEGVLWVGTDGNGLARFHQNKWTRYTIGDG